jgi:hypothetical protein
VFILKIDELKAKSIEKFGFCWDDDYGEKLKAESRNLINSGTLTDKETVEHCIIVFKALFSRSLEHSYYNLKHIDFKTYVAMLLNQEQWKNAYSKKIYNMLVDTYGKKKGIPTGTYYKIKAK